MPEKVFRQEMLWGRAIGIRDRERLRDWNFLRCRSTIKTIHKNHKLAFGSDSVIFMNNIVVQHQRKSTVPAEVPGPVFHSSVPQTFPALIHIFFKFFTPPFQYMARSSFSRATPNVLPLFAAFPPPGPIPGKLRPPPREINKVKQVRLFLSWKYKNLDRYPIHEPLQISVVVLGYVLAVMTKPSALSEHQRVCWRFCRFSQAGYILV